MAKDPDPSWGRSTGASSIIRQPIVRRPARRAAPPVVTATTSRHKKLLGASTPQPPPAEPKGKAAAPLSPIPSPKEDDIDDDGPVDVDAYLNTGADIDDLYMVGADEEPFRARDEPAGPPKATKQRLVFSGFSEETPPAADTQDPTAANIFSPNTLLKKVNKQFEASGPLLRRSPVKDLVRTRRSPSQPPPTIRHRDSMVPPSKDGLTRMHEAGKPILGPELQHSLGDMLPLQDSIQVLENILLKDKDPNYPVFEMPTYVVYKGRVPGVYEEWQDCLEQVHKFSGNSYKGYTAREEAVAQWRAHVGKKKNRLKFLVPLLLTATAVVLYFTLV
ncbi:hypothetical protein QYE76_070149 [Lolium multiflorum]|uniref:Ribonuclease H1 N-terminal domain-containing protein n=1 Tax=Lolium multiflorum TaxID=4521 RepID=A0AAD8SIM5_LOLMU|nr:hypothetical protein QYE76_070149 [Lolium multiflorum]